MRYLISFLTIISSLSAMERQPNIVLIFTDDQGYEDLGCFVVSARL